MRVKKWAVVQGKAWELNFLSQRETFSGIKGNTKKLTNMCLSFSVNDDWAIHCLNHLQNLEFSKIKTDFG